MDAMVKVEVESQGGVNVSVDESAGDSFRVITSVCAETAKYLTPAVATLVAGGVINFLLSYHVSIKSPAMHP